MLRKFGVLAPCVVTVKFSSPCAGMLCKYFVEHPAKYDTIESFRPLVRGCCVKFISHLFKLWDEFSSPCAGLLCKLDV